MNIDFAKFRDHFERICNDANITADPYTQAFRDTVGGPTLELTPKQREYLKQKMHQFNYSNTRPLLEALRSSISPGNGSVKSTPPCLNKRLPPCPSNPPPPLKGITK